MAYVGVLLLAAMNCAIFFFASLLAASGNGGSDGLVTFWRWGFAWIGAFTVIAILLCIKGKKELAGTITALTLPIGFFAVKYLGI